MRSDAITQEEIAYYFVALALGLVNGLHPGRIWVAPAVSAGLVAMMYLADHPRFASRAHRQTVTLDRANPQEPAPRAALEQLLAAKVLHQVVECLDLVRDSTVADVRFRTDPKQAASTHTAEHDQFASVLR